MSVPNSACVCKCMCDVTQLVSHCYLFVCDSAFLMSKLHNLSTKLRQQVLESLKLFFDFKIISGYVRELLKTYCFHSEHIFFHSLIMGSK